MRFLLNLRATVSIAITKRISINSSLGRNSLCLNWRFKVITASKTNKDNHTTGLLPSRSAIYLDCFRADK